MKECFEFAALSSVRFMEMLHVDDIAARLAEIEAGDVLELHSRKLQGKVSSVKKESDQPVLFVKEEKNAFKV